MKTILTLCKCIIRRLDASLANEAAILQKLAAIQTQQAAQGQQLNWIQATGVRIAGTVDRIDAAVEEPEPEAAGFFMTFTKKE